MRDYGALHRFIAERSAMPFAWGHDRNDCVSFAAAAVKAMTGRVITFGGYRWATALGASRAVQSMGGMVDAVDAELHRIEPAFARRGDIAGVPARPGGNDLLLAVIEGDTLAGPAENGLFRLSRTMMVIAWSAE
jgi:hypothetical protein